MVMKGSSLFMRRELYTNASMQFQSELFRFEYRAPHFPTLVLDAKSCKACHGNKFYLWWETSRRQMYSCTNPDCGVFLEVKKTREVLEF